MRDADDIGVEHGGTALGRRTRGIVDELGAAIVTGRYAAGEVLPVEAELGERFGASRTILREAIKILTAKGLLAVKRRRGTSVTPPSSWDLFDPDVLRWTLLGDFSLPLLIDFTVMRLGIEPLAAELAARAPADARRRVEAAFGRMLAAEDGRDDPLAADIAFHLAIIDASGNRFFGRLKPLVTAALHFSIRYTDRYGRGPATKIEVHRALSDAIAAGNAPRAGEAARALLDAGLSLMRRRLEDGDGADR